MTNRDHFGTVSTAVPSHLFDSGRVEQHGKSDGLPGAGRGDLVQRGEEGTQILLLALPGTNACLDRLVQLPRTDVG